MPPLPYIFRRDGLWHVQWYAAGDGRRLVRSRSFRTACAMAATVRRWQMRGAS